VSSRVEKQTPIEILLGVDKEGMTTAKKLYAFLELNPVNFSRWCKKNIVENIFADANIDYLRLFLQEETPTGGKIERIDYKITASFAKKLAMISPTEKGEEARNYFVRVEQNAKGFANGKMDCISPQGGAMRPIYLFLCQHIFKINVSKSTNHMFIIIC
jgi:phage anti-repressor protein